MKFKKPNQKGLELNLTSMMDVVFLLIIFFILVTNFAAADLPPLEPPHPEDSVARKLEHNQPRIVNIVPVMTREADPIRPGVMRDVSTGRANYVVAYDLYFVVPGYRGDLPDDARGVVHPLPQLVEKLRAERIDRAAQGGDVPQMEVDLRVDRSIPYSQVQPIMQAITSAEITRVNLVALVGTHQD